MTTRIADTLEKLSNGSTLKNRELLEAAEHFGKLVELLSGLGPVWRMPLHEAIRTHDRLTGFVNARGLKKPAAIAVDESAASSPYVRIAREFVRVHYPQATSCYTKEGAEVYDAVTNRVLGRAPAGENSVEAAWEDAALQLSHEPATT